MRSLILGLQALLAIGPLAPAAAQPASPPGGTRTVQLDGRPVRVQTIGLEHRRPGAPILVLEAGATQSLDAWAGLLPELTALAPVIAYDRAGLGQSAWDEKVPTPEHVGNRLHRLLGEVGAEPPYLLVGYSWGGILARYYAGLFPGDIAGMVLVDPGPIVTQSLRDNLVPFEAVGSGRAGYEAYWSGFAALFQNAAPAVRAEFAVFRGLLERDPSERGLRPIPPVPLAVIVAAKYLPLPMLKVPYDPDAHFQADLRHRIGLLQEWVLASPRGTLFLSNHSTHAILREDPSIVVMAVRRVLAEIEKGSE